VQGGWESMGLREEGLSCGWLERKIKTREGAVVWFIFGREDDQ
jgi:hypothetical protein